MTTNDCRIRYLVSLLAIVLPTMSRGLTMMTFADLWRLQATILIQPTSRQTIPVSHPVLALVHAGDVISQQQTQSSIINYQISVISHPGDSNMVMVVEFQGIYLSPETNYKYRAATCHANYNQ